MTDYYPFGSERNGSNSKEYRWNLQGQEKDSETGLIVYKYRMYDPQTGRFKSTDPLEPKYPWNSSYAFSENRVIDGVELEGLEFYYTADGALLGSIEGSTEVRLVNDKDMEAVCQSVSSNNFHIARMKESGLKSDYDNSIIPKDEADRLSVGLDINNEVFIAFASVIHAESSGNKEESYAIGNVTMNFINEGGSRGIPTLEDAVMYDNTFAQGATLSKYRSFLALTSREQNSKYALGAAINAVAYSKGLESFSDFSEGADSWDGIDLVSSKWTNNHRDYIWSEGSKDLLLKYKKDNKGGVDVSKFSYSKTGFQIEATKIIGKTLYTNLVGGRGERKQNPVKFTPNEN